MLGETSIMIRRPSLKVIQELSRVSAEDMPPRFIFCILCTIISHQLLIEDNFTLSNQKVQYIVFCTFSWTQNQSFYMNSYFSFIPFFILKPDAFCNELNSNMKSLEFCWGLSTWTWVGWQFSTGLQWGQQEESAKVIYAMYCLAKT